jgi:uncharacterized HAD superfamily protein
VDEHEARLVLAARVDDVDPAAEDRHLARVPGPVDPHPRRVVAVRVGRVRPGPEQAVVHRGGDLSAYGRHERSTVSKPMRIAIDIDSTLHHYWDLLEAAAKRRFGVSLPYAEQVTWNIPILRPEQLKACVAETHRESAVLGAEPYPGAVEAVREWHAAGHFIHVTSHRAAETHDWTARWLDRIELPYDDLHCSADKIVRCRELGIDLLVDDSPVNLARAVEAGMLVATLSHPWNEELCEEEDVICADDWPGLAAALAPVLARGRTAA